MPVVLFMIIPMGIQHKTRFRNPGNKLPSQSQTPTERARTRRSESTPGSSPRVYISMFYAPAIARMHDNTYYIILQRNSLPSCKCRIMASSTLSVFFMFCPTYRNLLRMDGYIHGTLYGTYHHCSLFLFRSNPPCNSISLQFTIQKSSTPASSHVT